MKKIINKDSAIAAVEVSNGMVWPNPRGSTI